MTPDPVSLAEEVLPVLAEHAADVDRESRFPVEAMAAILAEGCLSTAMIWAMHCQQVDTIARYGQQVLKEKLLPRIADGSVYVASVTSERGKGGHLLTATAPLVAAGDRLLIDRNAPVVTGGLQADGYLMTMREHADATP